MKSLRSISLCLFAVAASALISPPADAQTATTNTTLAAAMGRSDQTITLSSSTGVSAASATNPVTGLYVDREYMTVLSNVNPAGTGNVWNVKRNVAGIQSTHVSGALVWVSVPSTFDLGVNDRVGACTAASFPFLPIVEVRSGTLMNCDGNGKYSPLGVGSFYVPPTQCTFLPTTLTTTNTYIQVGASAVFVLNGLTNAAAGTLTLTCNIMVPSAVQALRGAILTDVTLFLGSQTLVPTSLGTSTLGSITFPAAATTETPSTVTPVTIGGTVTTTGGGATSFLSAITTAGSFFTLKHTYSTVVDLSTDLRILQYTLPILQSAGAAMVVNTPGLLIHYRWPLTQ